MSQLGFGMLITLIDQMLQALFMPYVRIVDDNYAYIVSFCMVCMFLLCIIRKIDNVVLLFGDLVVPEMLRECAARHQL